jgi:hypothetical protein
VATGCLAAYRARSPRATPLYRLFDAHFDEVKGQWEERFERRCGFWRGFVDEQELLSAFTQFFLMTSRGRFR